MLCKNTREQIAGLIPWPKFDLVVGSGSTTMYMNLQYKHDPNDFDGFQSCRLGVLELGAACLIEHMYITPKCLTTIQN
jgi:hypothetical protein